MVALRMCFPGRGLGLLLLLGSAVQGQLPSRDPGADERAVVERYHLNAQYRGGVKKGFSDIGSGSVAFHRLGEKSFRVRMKGSVEHPDNRQIYSLELSMWFELDGATVVDVRQDNRYNERAQEYRDRVEKIVPFVYLVKFLPVPGAGQEPTRRFLYRGKEFIIRYVRTPRHFEATIYEGDSMVAKFFILPTPREAPVLFEKFRLPAEEDLMLSFVRDLE